MQQVGKRPPRSALRVRSAYYYFLDFCFQCQSTIHTAHMLQDILATCLFSSCVVDSMLLVLLRFPFTRSYWVLILIGTHYGFTGTVINQSSSVIRRLFANCLRLLVQWMPIILRRCHTILLWYVTMDWKNKLVSLLRVMKLRTDGSVFLDRSYRPKQL
jgi:hypothetical protein